MTTNDNDKVYRFSKPERIAHWLNAACFFLLFLTCLVVFSPACAPLAILFGGIQGARVLHRITAIVFTFGAISVLVFGDWKAFKVWIKDILTWGPNDFKFLLGFGKEFFGGHPELPEQGRFNAGEKINSLLTIGGSCVLIITGFGMWYASSLPIDLVRWFYPLHTLFAFLMTAVVIGHSYLGLLHPGSKEAMNGMIGGYVTKKFAQGHHGKWYREVVRKE